MTAGELTAADFDAFFEALYPKKPEDDKQKTPFPWQRRLAKQVCETGAWPATLDLPTGTGKTTVLDIAVFAMAVDAARPSNQRKMPRRAILVVDRRTVVDQAELRTRRIAKKLAEAQPGTILGRVAQALHGLRGDVTWAKRWNARPLEVAYLRGAIPRDDGWARDPSQPMLGVSTVDQVGSRLLFRGYGVSPGMRSVHAGLLGNDIVYFLDEVHLSQPFAETLAAVGDWRSRAKATLPAKLHVVTMSATHHGDDGAAAFQLDDDDRRDPTLYRRLGAKKPATLEIVKVAGDEDRRRSSFAQRLADLAVGATTERRRRVAVVVNRVNTALAIHDLIAAKLSKEASLVLVTGRMRPLDREDRERDLRRVQASEPRTEGDPIQIVVATQCIEAGADLDFDVLITECASLDAVVQRFGRLDRLGDHGDACGVVAIRSDHLSDHDDPVYGGARTATWQWLNERTAPLDFGLNGEVRTGAPASVFPDPRNAPVLLPAHLDLWSQTRPTPFPDPDVALWLHGRQDGSPEVNIVWRADLTVSDDSNERIDNDALDDIFDVSPPLRQEALAVPLWAAEAWLQNANVEGIADVEGARHGDVPRDDDPAARRWFIRWRGGDDKFDIVDGSRPPDQRRLRPGDTIIVPATYGGIRAGTWAADSLVPVVDRGDEAQLRQRRRLVVRLDALLVPVSQDTDPGEVAWRSNLRKLVDQLVDERDEADATPEELAPIINKIRDELKRAAATRPWLAVVDDLKLRALPMRTRVVLTATTKVPRFRDEDGSDPDALPEVSSDDDRASRTGVEVSLVDHLAHVKEQAAAFASSHGLPLGVATDVVLAAAWHDAGKADPRFQRWLVDGDEVTRAARSAPLAKSAHDSSDGRRRRAARTRAQYPRGARHELASVAMLENAEAVLAKADDRDLVLHLIASHHGWCRPYAPVEAAGEAVDITWEHEGVPLAASSDHGLAQAGASVVDRFWNMTQKYGWWGLAWLETLVRLADHRASQTEQEQGRKGGTP